MAARKRKASPLGGVSLPLRREDQGMPVREWLYLAGVVGCLAAGAFYDGEGGPVLVSLGCALVLSAMLWSSRKKRLGGERRG